MWIKPKLILSLIIFLSVLAIMVQTMVKDSAGSVDASESKPWKDVTVQVPDEKNPESPSVVGEYIDETYKFTTENLFMRAGPGKDYEAVKIIPLGEKVQVFQEESGWFNISYDGATGYSSGKYLADTLEDIGTLQMANNQPATNIQVTGELMKEVNGILLVNKAYGLPSDYNPGENSEARKYLNEMLEEALNEINIKIAAFSGFRSFDYQKRLYEGSIESNGNTYTEIFSAMPGHSEHQTGLAFDIGGHPKYWAEPEFGDTEEAEWLEENAHRFGFILRYPKGKESSTGYSYEPWHFRYVGNEHAKIIFEEGLTLEEYLLGN